jgi:hypothetical protein
MPPIPDATVSFLDGALGLAAEKSDRTQVKLGTSSAGTANVLQSFSRVSDLQATFGQGPLVEAAARVLAVAGGPVLCMKVNGSVAGAAAAPTATATGTATLALTGSTPYDSYELLVQIIKGGATLAAGTATFKWSLDGGRTLSDEIAVPTAGTYPIPNSGITLTWTYSAGTAFAPGDKWVSACTAPGYTTTDLANAVTPLLADPRTWFMTHVVGPAADLSGARGLFAALATHMGTAEKAYRFAFALMEAPDGTDAALVANTTGLGDLADVRVAVAGGYEQLISPISGRLYKRSVAWEAAARLSKVDPSQDIGAVEDGPLTGVVALYRDEQATPGLDAARFVTVRTIINRQGYYITRGRMFAPANSDFKYMTNRRVIDIAASALRDRALGFLLSRIPTNADGTIQDRRAKGIEQSLERAVRDAAGADIVNVSVAIDRTNNILSTGELRVEARIQPFGYASTITVAIGFTSPAIAAAA